MAAHRVILEGLCGLVSLALLIAGLGAQAHSFWMEWAA